MDAIFNLAVAYPEAKILKRFNVVGKELHYWLFSCELSNPTTNELTQTLTVSVTSYKNLPFEIKPHHVKVIAWESVFDGYRLGENSMPLNEWNYNNFTVSLQLNSTRKTQVRITVVLLYNIKLTEDVVLYAKNAHRIPLDNKVFINGQTRAHNGIDLYYVADHQFMPIVRPSGVGHVKPYDQSPEMGHCSRYAPAAPRPFKQQPVESINATDAQNVRGVWQPSAMDTNSYANDQRSVPQGICYNYFSNAANPYYLGMRETTVPSTGPNGRFPGQDLQYNMTQGHTSQRSAGDPSHPDANRWEPTTPVVPQHNISERYNPQYSATWPNQYIPDMRVATHNAASQNNFGVQGTDVSNYNYVPTQDCNTRGSCDFGTQQGSAIGGHEAPVTVHQPHASEVSQEKMGLLQIVQDPTHSALNALDHGSHSPNYQRNDPPTSQSNHYETEETLKWQDIINMANVEHEIYESTTILGDRANLVVKHEQINFSVKNKNNEESTFSESSQNNLQPGPSSGSSSIGYYQGIYESNMTTKNPNGNILEQNTRMTQYTNVSNSSTVDHGYSTGQEPSPNELQEPESSVDRVAHFGTPETDEFSSDSGQSSSTDSE